MLPHLIERKCPAQKDICKAIAACKSEGAIYYVADEQAPLGGRIEFDYDRCTACGDCATECCGKAIEMKEAGSGAASPPAAGSGIPSTPKGGRNVGD